MQRGNRPKRNSQNTALRSVFSYLYLCMVILLHASTTKTCEQSGRRGDPPPSLCPWSDSGTTRRPGWLSSHHRGFARARRKQYFCENSRTLCHSPRHNRQVSYPILTIPPGLLPDSLKSLRKSNFSNLSRRCIFQQMRNGTHAKSVFFTPKEGCA